MKNVDYSECCEDTLYNIDLFTNITKHFTYLRTVHTQQLHLVCAPQIYADAVSMVNINSPLIDWLSMVLRLRQHNIGYTADGFYRSDDPTNSVKALKEGG